MRLVALACVACAHAAPAPEKSLAVAQVQLVDDYVTIVDFWSDSCAACTIVTGMIAVQIADQPRIVVRKIDVGDGFTPVARANQVSTLPHINVYDRKRRLRYVLIGNECLRAPDLARELARE